MHFFTSSKYLVRPSRPTSTRPNIIRRYTKHRTDPQEYSSKDTSQLRLQIEAHDLAQRSVVIRNMRCKLEEKRRNN